MSETLLRRLDWLVTEDREAVDPGALGVDTLFHYSIPVLDDIGDGQLEPAEEIGSGKLLLRGGEVLVSKLNPRISRVLLAEAHDVPTVASTEFIALRPGPDVDERFLRYWLGAEHVRQFLDGATMSVTRSQQRIRPDILTKHWVSFPSLAAQRATADFLDVETSRIDGLVAKKRALLGLVERRHLTLIFSAVTGSASERERHASGIDWIGDLPQHWGTPWLGANYETQLGKMLNAEAAAGPELYPYLRNVNVQWDRFDLDDLGVMDFDADDRRRHELHEGDLLVCEGGEVGRAAVWPGWPPDVYFQKAIHRVRPLVRGNTRFLMYCLRAAAFRNVFSVEGNQSTIVHLTGEKLREHRFPFPPLEEQAEIVQKLDANRDLTIQLCARLQKQIELLLEHRQALITSAVTGDLEAPGAAA